MLQVSTNPIDHELLFRDEFDNYVNFRKGTYKLAAPTVISDAHWKHQTYFMIFQPLDSITFIRDSNDNFWTAKTNDVKMDKELNFDVSYRREIAPIVDYDEFYFSKTKYSKNGTLRDLDIDSVFNKKKEYLNHYRKKFGLSSDFEEAWQKFIKYEKAYQKLTLSRPFTKWDNSYLVSLSSYSKGLSDDKSLFIPFYRMALWNSLSIDYYLSTGFEKASLVDYFNHIVDKFKGETRDYLLTFLLVAAKSKTYSIASSQSEFNSQLNKYYKICKNDEYKNYIIQSEALSNMTFAEGQLVNISKQKVNLSGVISNHTLTYVDFWASWCAPCRAEMPASKKLKAMYESKDVQFVYLSVDENPAAWERAMKQLGLADKESFLVPDPANSGFTMKFKLKEIPRYVLLDRQGNVLDANAPRPSDPKVRQVLDRALEE
jgi:thiol-disulfide isomerase/thioredoxin